jgi:hypothetical protein
MISGSGNAACRETVNVMAIFLKHFVANAPKMRFFV